MKMKNWLLVLGVLILAAAPVMAGGGGQQGAKTAAVNEAGLLNPLGQLPLLKEKIELTMGILKDPLVTDYVNNYKTMQLEKDSNIHLNFVSYGSTSSEANQKLELQIMAGGADLPDIINMSFSPINAAYYGEQGAIIPLDTFIKNSAYHIKEGLKEIPYDPWRYIASTDGHTYTLFVYQGGFETDVCARIYLNTAWLKEVGLSIPTSTKEFENMLRAFKNHTFNNDGKKTYPFIDIRANMTEPRFVAPLVAPFVYIGQRNNWFYKEPNGAISPVFTTEKWREALTWIRGMVDEGLIDPLSFTQDAEQIKAIGGSTNGYPYGASTYYPLNFIPLTDPRSETWALMGPLSGPSGGDPVPSYSYSMPANHYAITKNCKYPEAAFRMGDLLMSERYSVMGRFGEEGVDWKRPEPGMKTYYPGYDPYLIPIAVWGTPTNKHWEQGEPRILPYKVMNGFMIQGQLRHLDLWNAQASAQGMKYFDNNKVIGTLVYSRSEYDQIAEIQANITTYFKECYTRFLLRDMSLENDWNKYLAELQSMGLDTYVRISRAAYARMTK
jgi:putative aldouronate transport system substrate-binding protein